MTDIPSMRNARGGVYKPSESYIFRVEGSTNVGSPYNVFKRVADNDVEFRGLTAGTGISLTENTNDITVLSTPAGTASLGGDAGIVAGDGTFRSILGGTGITVTENENDISVTSTSNLSDTLVNGNTTTGNDIIISTGDQITAATNLVVRPGGVVNLANDTVITGDSIKTQSLTAINSTHVLYNDAHVDLNTTHTANTQESFGIVTTYLPIANIVTVAGNFTAGVDGVSNPTVITVESGTLSTSDIVLIKDANDAGNNGYFEVLTHTGTTLTIRGIGVTANVEEWTKTQFVSDTVVAGTITPVNATVMRINNDIIETAYGSTTPFTFSGIYQWTASAPLQRVGNAISVADSAITPGAYTSANITVDGYGRITAVASGSAGNTTYENEWYASTGLAFPTSYGIDNTYWTNTLNEISGISWDADGIYLTDPGYYKVVTEMSPNTSNTLNEMIRHTTLFAEVYGSGTFTVPPGVTSLSVTAVGGGGGGGGILTTNIRGSGGGGGGALAYDNSVAVTPGESLTVVVGAAGAAGAAGDGAAGDGGAGGDSGIKRSTTWLVQAGGGGGGGGGGSATASTGGAGGTVSFGSGGAGGSGGTGGTVGGGGGGGAGGYTGTGGTGAIGGTSGAGTAGTGGGGGGGGAVGGTSTADVSGGGVGYFGEGTSGAGGLYTFPGDPGSGGTLTVYGGGGGGLDDDNPRVGYPGGIGGVNISYTGSKPTLKYSVNESYTQTTSANYVVTTELTFVLDSTFTSHKISFNTVRVTNADADEIITSDVTANTKCRIYIAHIV